MKKQMTFWTVALLINVSVIAQEFSTANIINEELKGMMFSGKIDYKPDCSHSTPFIRATLHSVEVTRFTYNGKIYDGTDIKGVTFPLKVKGYLSISAILSIGYNGEGRRFQLKKTSLSTSIGGRGNEFMADEFRFTDGEINDLKKYFNTSSCVDLSRNKKYLSGRLTYGYGGADIKIFDGDLRYKGQSLNLYLIGLIKNQEKGESRFKIVMEETAEYLSDNFSVTEYKQAISKLEDIPTGTLDKYQKSDIENRLEKLNDYLTYAEEQAIEKKYDYLDSYTKYSNKQSAKYYFQGNQKVQSLIRETKNRKEKEILELISKRIENNYNQASKNELSRAKLNADLKRIKSQNLNQSQNNKYNQQNMNNSLNDFGNAMSDLFTVDPKKQEKRRNKKEFRKKMEDMKEAEERKTEKKLKLLEEYRSKKSKKYVSKKAVISKQLKTLKYALNIEGSLLNSSWLSLSNGVLMHETGNNTIKIPINKFNPSKGKYSSSKTFRTRYYSVKYTNRSKEKVIVNKKYGKKNYVIFHFKTKEARKIFDETFMELLTTVKN